MAQFQMLSQTPHVKALRLPNGRFTNPGPKLLRARHWRCTLPSTSEMPFLGLYFVIKHLDHG